MDKWRQWHNELPAYGQRIVVKMVDGTWVLGIYYYTDFEKTHETGYVEFYNFPNFSELNVQENMYTTYWHEIE